MWRWLAVAVALGASGCAVFRPPAVPAPGGGEVGVASWYGPGFHGRLTASGEPYDQWALTAAHRTLPLGTRVRVTSLENGRAVDVRINDRGPFVGGRVIDLSRAAAESLRMVEPGLMRVRVEALAGPGGHDAPGVGPARHFTTPRGLVYVVQVGSFRRRASADAVRARLAGRLPGVQVDPAGHWWRRRFRVRAGPYASRAAALEHARVAARLGYRPIVMQTARP